MPAATIEPVQRIGGRVRVPGDKSISHRYAMLAALADGSSRLAGYAPGADCQSTLGCLRQLGIDVAVDAKGDVTIQGRGPSGFRPPASVLDAGNSGTTMRLMTGVLSGLPL